jgi:outer membrane lipoprotein-sorting protein
MRANFRRPVDRRRKTAHLSGMFRTLGLALLFAALLWRGAGAQAPGPNDAADIARVEAYLNSITTMSARFVQVAPHGGHAEGRIWLQRPGLLRFEYDPPVKDFIVVTGLFLVHWDGELKTSKHIPVSNTPLAFLLTDRISLAGEVMVKAIERRSSTLRLTVANRADPAAGSVTLVFEDRPLQLRQWSVIDAQGQVTNIAFANQQFGQAIERKLFEFHEPPKDLR